MFHTIIGDAAGEVWQLLKQEGPMSMNAIVGKIKRPQSAIYMGIGWLAREDKLTYTQMKRGMLLSIKQ